MQQIENLGFVHKFVPATSERADGVTMLLLHGTGGDENDLLALGRELLPGAALLGVRGNILENGMRRFFRRFGEGIFDIDDLKLQTDELAKFIDRASDVYGFNKKHLIVVGYSNGANIGASLILMHPHYLSAAVLFRVMVPYDVDIIRDFSKLSILIGAGEDDPIVPEGDPEELAATFESGGASVTVAWHHGGHELGSDDVSAAKQWLSQDNLRKISAKAS
jgi:predicted esterase